RYPQGWPPATAIKESPSSWSHDNVRRWFYLLREKTYFPAHTYPSMRTSHPQAEYPLRALREKNVMHLNNPVQDGDALPTQAIRLFRRYASAVCEWENFTHSIAFALRTG